MPVARPESSDSRIIAHVDMDCFYVQVEQRKQPELRGLPTAVVQYNEWKGGALIAVSYEARNFGVKRSMRGDEAKQVCPQIRLVQVPVARGKADLNAYRNAGSEVVSILAKKGRCERASIDEVYLDLTDSAEAMLMQTPPDTLTQVPEEALNSHVLGLKVENGNDAKEKVREWICRSDADHRDKLLACGAFIVAELRMQVLKETEFTCSAGIAHNKMLAKLASGMNKPAQQTVVPFSAVTELLDSLPIKKMKQLGGKLGTSLQIELGVNTVGDLLQFSEEKLQDCYGINTGTWLWNIARGISGEEVQGRLLPKSHGSGKSFPGPRALKTVALVQHWLNQLGEELSERLCSDLDQNKRIARTLTLHASAYKSSDSDSHRKFPSKSCPLRYGTSKIQEDAFNLFQSGLREYLGLFGVKIQGSHQNNWGVTALSVSASKIIDIPSGTCSIVKYFQGQDISLPPSVQKPDNLIKEAAPLSPLGSESCDEVKSTEKNGEYALPYSGEEDENRTAWKDQFQAEDDLAQEPSTSLQSGSEGNLGLKQSNLKGQSSRGEVDIKGGMLSLGRRREQKRNALKDLVQNGSILRFFKSQSQNIPSPSTKQEGVRMDKGTKSASSGARTPSISNSCSSSNLNQVELPEDRLLTEHGANDRSSSDQNERAAIWNYKMDEIDPSVIDELPPEIQEEIRAWLRPHKRPNVKKQGPSIAHYFSPSNS